MPRAAIPGFVKKRTAALKYNRSPRQITRDITVALDMRDEKVLPHLRIRTEDGEILEGADLTGEMIKDLRMQGRNPAWYLRKNWLQESYGRRTSEGPNDQEENIEDEVEAVAVSTAEPVNNSIIQMMQETIRELRNDKDRLNEQLKIKDQQINESSERWKETNIISHRLNERLESMEKRIELATRQTPVIEDRTLASVRTVDTTISGPNVPARKKSRLSRRKSPAAKNRKRTISNKTTKSKAQSRRKRQPAKWYEMPTFKDFFSR